MLCAVRGNHDSDARLIDLADFADEVCFDTFARFADRYEQAHHARLALDRQRRRYARAHGAMRLALAQPGEGPVAAPFARSAAGKPFLEDGPHFSLSHAGGQSWLAISNAPVGLDVVEGGQPDLHLDHTFVTAQDRAALHRRGVLPADINTTAWAIKEASAKLADDVDRAPGLWQVRCGAGLTVVSGGHDPIIVELRAPAPGHIAAIARWQPAIEKPDLA
ncbi:MAG: hypothetical protein JSR96_07480 [Proteobacteria bacterium]|nr:hypothetical protein [Pseudomonadota bacterium]